MTAPVVSTQGSRHRPEVLGARPLCYGLARVTISTLYSGSTFSPIGDSVTYHPRVMWGPRDGGTARGARCDDRRLPHFRAAVAFIAEFNRMCCSPECSLVTCGWPCTNGKPERVAP